MKECTSTVRIEGAELGVLRGSKKLLKGSPRQTILLKVQHLRTRPWSYRAQETVQWLAAGYRWFDLEAEGKLEPAPTDLAIYDANLAALAEQRLAETSGLITADASARCLQREFQLAGASQFDK